MRFEGNTRGISREDYREFSNFLGLSQPKYSRDNVRGITAENSENQTQGKPIGMVYGVKQGFYSIYDPEIALEQGTIFEELNKPFYPVGCKSKSGEGCL
ncbi:MAG: spore coat associated protein CotJA [Ruminococcaceae bacterium]|nr:spore coat associated protein CotJA [Oscillospiraceae bacterium]